jgi:2'-5' RNA ligase/GNAT superfamily N-acetyltransferase
MERQLWGAGFDRGLIQRTIDRLLESRQSADACYFLIPLSDQPEVQHAQYDVLNRLPSGVALEPQDPNDLHLTLLFVERMKDDQVEQFFERLGHIAPMRFFIEVVEVTTFPDAPSHPLVLRVNGTPSLLRLQAEMYNVAFSMGLPISPYSIPSAFKPHITLATKLDPPDIRLPKLREPFFAEVSEFIAGRDNYKTIWTATLPSMSLNSILITRRYDFGMVRRGAYSKSKCMECDKPPTKMFKWAEGMALAWFCDKHAAKWRKEHEADIDYEYDLPKGIADKAKAVAIHRGGPGSGFYGHAGRPGEVGGSLPRGEVGAAANRLPLSAVRDGWTHSQFGGDQGSWQKKQGDMHASIRSPDAHQGRDSYEGRIWNKGEEVLQVKVAGNRVWTSDGNFPTKNQAMAFAQHFFEGKGQYVPLKFQFDLPTGHWHNGWFTADDPEKLASHLADYGISGGTSGAKAPKEQGIFSYGQWSMIERGGPGSGHFGHAGRPGEIGGSLPSGKVAFAANQTPSTVAIPRDILSKAFFHGEDNSAKAEQLLTTGIIPPGSEGKKPSKGFLIPVPGRTYATSNPEYALIYALGADMAGSDLPESFIKGKGRYGYIFQIDNTSLADLQPDEDAIGEAIWRGDYTWLSNLARQHLTEHQYRKVLEGEYAYFAVAGKKLAPLMSADRKFQMIRDGAAIASLGPMRISKAWRIDKTRSPELARKEWGRQDTGAAGRISKIWEVADLVKRGGPGSGHFGHAGRPGEIGGSLPSGETGTAESKSPRAPTESPFGGFNVDEAKQFVEELSNKPLQNSPMRRRGFTRKDAAATEHAAVRLYKDYPTLGLYENNLPVGESWLSPKGLAYIIPWTHQDWASNLINAMVGREPGFKPPPEEEAIGKKIISAEFGPDGLPAERLLLGLGWVRVGQSGGATFGIEAMEPLTRAQKNVLGRLVVNIEAKGGTLAYELGTMENNGPAKGPRTGDLEEFKQVLGFRSYAERGGPGSGHFGHAGRPGEIGGSLPAGDVSTAGSTIAAEVKANAISIQSPGPAWQPTSPGYAKLDAPFDEAMANLNAADERGDTPAVWRLDAIATAIRRGMTPSLKNETVIARDGQGKLVGAMAFDRSEDLWFESDKAPHPCVYLEMVGSTKHGVGRALMERLIAIAAEQRAGIRFTALKGAIGFYDKFGFAHMKDLPSGSVEMEMLPGDVAKAAQNLTIRQEEDDGLSDEPIRFVEPRNPQAVSIYKKPIPIEIKIERWMKARGAVVKVRIRKP